MTRDELEFIRERLGKVRRDLEGLPQLPIVALQMNDGGRPIIYGCSEALSGYIRDSLADMDDLLKAVEAIVEGRERP